MKVKLIFDLNDRDDELSYENCVKAQNMADFIEQLKYNIPKEARERFEYLKEKKQLKKRDILDIFFELINEDLNQF